MILRFCFFAFLLMPLASFGQGSTVHFPDSLFSTYYHQRVSLFRSLPMTAGDIIFIGNSITDGGEWSELFADLRVKNRGISGDNTVGVLNRLDEVIGRQPAKVFLMIGVNDLARGVAADSVLMNLRTILRILKQEVPSSELFVQSILPVSDAFGKFGGHTSKGESIRYINNKLKEEKISGGYEYVDLYPSFLDAAGKLSAAYTNDGLHLIGPGYKLWKQLVQPYIR